MPWQGQPETGGNLRDTRPDVSGIDYNSETGDLFLRFTLPPTTPRRRRASTGDRFFRHLVCSMRTGVVAIHRDGRVATMNAEAYRILGIPESPEDVGRPVSDVLHRHPALVRVFSGVFELSHLPNRAELRLESGHTVIGYTLSFVRDGRSRLRGAVLFFKDLTLVERAEERERLRDRLAAVGEMAATIAHEVKNPLASIEVMAGLLRRKMADREDVLAMLGDIITEAKMANAIVLEVLDFVRPIRLQMDTMSIGQVVHDAIGVVDRKLTRRATAITLDIPADLPRLSGDHQQLCQVMTNLLTNACEAQGMGGAVHIQAREHHPRGADDTPAVVVAVRDDGPGIPSDIRDRIFNPFFSTKPQGSGLGLAIVRKIVDAHEGRIDVTSRHGHGTLFTITLPVIPPGRLAF